MRRVRIAFVGVGNVAQALGKLLAEKRTDLAAHFGTEVELCGVATRRFGFRLMSPALSLEALLAAPEQLAHMPSVQSFSEWLARARPQVLFEMSSLNPLDGEPAISYVRAALQAGTHVVTANTGAGHDGLIAECMTDTMPPIVIAARHISPISTAYDVLADFVTIVRASMDL